MKVYRVTGEFIVKKVLRKKQAKEGVNTIRKIKYRFSKEVLADSPENAKEYIYKLFGGVYKIKRKAIKINDIKELSLEEIKDKNLKKYLSENGEK